MLTATYYLHTKWICDYKLQLNKQHWWRELMTITMDQQMTSTLATTMHFYWHFVNCRVGLLALVVSKVKAVPHLHTVTEISDTNLLSLPYKVLTTTQPSYLRNLISLQPPRSTRSSSVVTLSQSLHWLKVNECNASNINFSLLLTKFLQLLNLAIFTTLSLFNLLAVPTLHLLSLSLASQPSPWKSQIAHLSK